MNEGNARAYLVRSVARQAANGRLDSSSGRVNIRLETGSVLVRHDCGCLFVVLLVFKLIALASS